LLAKAHQKVRRQRQDVHHTTALALVRANDTISHKDLPTANMVQNHHLAKSISDAGWSQFLSILTYKAVCAGRRVVAVSPAYTSQICSGWAKWSRKDHPSAGMPARSVGHPFTETTLPPRI
jgi:putative transposase